VKPAPSSQAPLRPLPVAADAWTSVSMDFIFGLPADAHDRTGVLLFVDRFSKMVHLTPVHATVTAEESAAIFVDIAFRHHALPLDIVSDREPRFTLAFWTRLFQLLGTRLRMSTAAHPETDGQTERANRVVEDMLRSYTNASWSEFLPMVEFALNNSVHASTGLTLFYVNNARHPRVPASLAVASPTAARDSQSGGGETPPTAASKEIFGSSGFDSSDDPSINAQTHPSGPTDISGPTKISDPTDILCPTDISGSDDPSGSPRAMSFPVQRDPATGSASPVANCEPNELPAADGSAAFPDFVLQRQSIARYVLRHRNGCRQAEGERGQARSKEHGNVHSWRARTAVGHGYDSTRRDELGSKQVAPALHWPVQNRRCSRRRLHARHTYCYATPSYVLRRPTQAVPPGVDPERGVAASDCDGAGAFSSCSSVLSCADLGSKRDAVRSLFGDVCSGSQPTVFRIATN
jgi:hypothetical protein